MRKEVMVTLIVVCAVLVVTGALVGAIVLITLNGLDEGDGKDLSFDWITLSDTGMYAYPKISGGCVYAMTEDAKSIIRYNITEKTHSTVFEHTEDKGSITNHYPSGDHLLIELFYFDYDDILNSTTRYLLLDLQTDTQCEITLDCLGLDFDYPYIVFHNFSASFDSDLYVYDIGSKRTTYIDKASWGKVSDGMVAYTNGPDGQEKGHLYDIMTERNEVIYESTCTSLEVHLKKGRCVLEETEDDGPTAKTFVYSYDLVSKKAVKVYQYRDWMTYSAFSGDYLFFADDLGFADCTVMVLDIVSGATATLAEHHWIASIATGTIDAEGNAGAWTANKIVNLVVIK